MNHYSEEYPMKRLRFWTNDEARHRAKGDANTAAYDPAFVPRHCAGATDGSCLGHDHPGETPTASFPGLYEPVPATPGRTVTS